MANSYSNKSSYQGYVPGPTKGSGQPAQQPSISETGIPPFLSILAQEAARRGYDATLSPAISQGISALGGGAGATALGSGAGSAATALGSIAPSSMGAAATAPAPMAAAATAPSGGVAGMSPLLSYGPGVLGAAGLYDAISNDREGIRGYGQSMASGAGIGWTVGGPIGAGIGAAAGGLAKLGQDLFDSGKTREQKERDKARDSLDQLGFFDKGDQTNDNNFWRGVTFKDGGKFEFGHDLGDKLPDGRQYFDVDFKDPRAEKAVGLTGPLAHLLSGGNENIRTSFNGYMANALLAGNPDDETMRQRAIELYQRAQITNPQQAAQAIQAMNVPDSVKQSYMQHLGEMSRPEGSSYVPRQATPAPQQTPQQTQQPAPEPIAPVQNAPQVAPPTAAAPSTSQALASRLGPQYNIFPAYQNKTENINNVRAQGSLPRIPTAVGLFS